MAASVRNCCVSLQIKFVKLLFAALFCLKKGILNERNREGRGKSFGCLLQSNNKYIWFDLFFFACDCECEGVFYHLQISIFFLWWYKRHRRENAWKKLGRLEIHYLSLILFLSDIFNSLSFYTTNKSLCSINFLPVAGLANVWQIFIVIKNKYYTLLKLLSLSLTVWVCESVCVKSTNFRFRLGRSLVGCDATRNELFCITYVFLFFIKKEFFTYKVVHQHWDIELSVS